MDIQTAIRRILKSAKEKKAGFSAYDITGTLHILLEKKALELPPGQTEIIHKETRELLKNLHSQGKIPGYHAAYTKKDGSVFLLYSPTSGGTVEFKSKRDEILEDVLEKKPDATNTGTTSPGDAKSPTTAGKNPAAAPTKKPEPKTAAPKQPDGGNKKADITPTSGKNPQKEDIVQEVRLIYSDVVGNNNKVWYGALRKNGDVYTEWGRVGKNMQTKTYPCAGRSKLEEKEREKLNKGYTHAQIISNQRKEVPVHNTNLLDIAIRQISKGEPVLDKLVKRLVQANIHAITTQSNITFNANTGVFATPLGVVTLSAILEAQGLLDEIEIALRQTRIERIPDTINKYLRLVPQDFGMRLDPRKMFPDDQAIHGQRSLLDSLEASYRLVTSPQTKADKDKETEEEPSLFDLTLEIASKKEIERIRTLYRKTRQSIHHYVSKLDVETVYIIHMPTQAEIFKKKGVPLGNIQELWHGTKMANVLNILRTGLQVSPPKTAARAGNLFGPGLYFSDQSTKSLNYASDYWTGGGRGALAKGAYMFLAQVAMGNPLIPSGGRNAPPPKGYHSYFAKAGKSGVYNNEMIVPNAYQALLSRLIEFS